MTASIWEPGNVTNIETVNADNTRKSQRFSPNVAGTVSFSLSNFAYAPSTGSLSITINGVTQFPGVDFVETSPSSFTLTTPVEAEDIVDAYGMVGSPAAQSASVSASAAIVAATAARDSAVSANTNAFIATKAAEESNTSAVQSSAAANDAMRFAQLAAESAGDATNTQIQSDLAVIDTSFKSFIKNPNAIVSRAFLVGLNTALSGIISTGDNIISAFSKLQNSINNINVFKADRASTLGGYGIIDAVKLGAANINDGPATRIYSGAVGDFAGANGAGTFDRCGLILGNNDNPSASTALQFLRGGKFAALFGIDTDNKLKFGSGSLGTTAHEIYHAGNPQPNVLNKTGGDMIGQLRGNPGSAVSPAFAFSNDTDSGFYSIGDGGIALSINSNPLMTFTAGQVGITGALTVRSTANGGNTGPTLINDGGLQITLFGGGGFKYLRLRTDGVLDIVDSGYTKVLMTLDDNGNIYLTGGINANYLTART